VEVCFSIVLDADEEPEVSAGIQHFRNDGLLEIACNFEEDLTLRLLRERRLQLQTHPKRTAEFAHANVHTFAARSAETESQTEVQRDAGSLAMQVEVHWRIFAAR